MTRGRRISRSVMLGNADRAGFVGNTLRLFFGQAGAQAINLVAMLVLTRLYLPDSYGMLTVFASLSILFCSISCLRYSAAVLLPNKKENAASLLVLCLVLVVLFSSLVMLVADLINKTGVHLGGFEGFGNYLYLLPLSILFGGTYITLNFWSVRHNRFGPLGFSRVAEAASSKATAIGAGYAGGGGPLGLIGAMVIGQAVSTLSIGWQVLKNERHFIRKAVNFGTLRTVARRYQAFAVYSGSALLESLWWVLVPFAFAVIFCPTVTGYYGLAMRVVQHPLSMMGESISKSFFNQISESHRSGKSWSENAAALFRFILSSFLVPAVLLAVVSRELFGFLFGEAWAESGIYVSILIPMFVCSLLYRPLSIIMDVQERQPQRVMFSLLRIALSVGAIGVGAWVGSPVRALLFFSAINTLIFIAVTVWLLKCAGVDYCETLRVLAVQSIFAVFFGAIAWAGRLIWPSNILCLLAWCSFLAMGHLGFLIHKKTLLKTVLISLVRRTATER